MYTRNMMVTPDPLYEAAHRMPLEHVVVYTAPLIIPVTGPVIRNGAIAVEGSRVVHVGDRDWVLDTVRRELSSTGVCREQHWRGVITPGLVNAHTHLQYTNMAEVGQGTYTNFHDWELGFNKVYEQVSSNPAQWKTSAEQGARMLLESGTTAAADIVTDSQAAGALASQGLHGVAYWEVMDWTNEDWRSNGIQQLVDQLHRLTHVDMPSIGISPHAPYTLETTPFVDLPDIARQLDMRLHIHLAETPMEAGSPTNQLSTYTSYEWSSRHWDNYQALKDAGYDASAIQFLDQLGSLGPDVHIAHGVWASAEDRRILRQRAVGVALCPRSNRITVTEKDAPIRSYLEEGNLLAIGTDSLCSSPSLDVLEDAALVYAIAREQGYEGQDLTHRIIRMLTLGGAQELGMHVGTGRIGQINAGATADLAFFDIPVDVSSSAGIEHTLEELVLHGAGTNCATVVSGTISYNRGVLEQEEL